LTILQRKSGQNRKREGCKWADNNIGLVELIPAIDFTVCAVVVELPFSDYDETTQTHFSATLASTYQKKHTTLVAECQVPVFLIGPRDKKQRKKRSAIKILHTQTPVCVPVSSRFTPAFFRSAD
jgi:hypothetical protein